MQESRLYNSRIISTYLEYFRDVRTDIDIEKLLLDSGIMPYEVEDEGHWLTQRQVDDFSNALMKQTNDYTLFRTGGRHMASSRSISAIRQFIVSFVTPIQAYAMLAKISSYVTRGGTVEIQKVTKTKVRIISKPREGVQEKPYQCENRKGAFETVAILFTHKLPTLEHAKCIHQGNNHCEYIISWEEPVFLKWKRVRSYSVVAAILLITGCSFKIPLLPLTGLAVLLTFGIIGISYYSDSIERKDVYAKVEAQGEAANRLLDQITVSYNNNLLIQEVGQAVASILNIDELLKSVMNMLQKRLDFDRGMIMLANPEKTELVYVCGFGYHPGHTVLVRDTAFNLNHPASKGPFVKSFREQIPCLITDISDFQEVLSTRSHKFAEALGVKSFICVPIIYEGQSQGILAVDNLRSNRPLGQSDVSILMGIAPQIAISINNAKSLQQAQESEERFRALGENSPDIIYTMDTEGLLTYVNPAGESILGYRREDLLGLPLLKHIKEEERAAYLQLLHRIRQNKETVKNFKVTFISRDGREKFFDMSGAPNFDARGNITGIVGTFKDYTEQHHMERQLNQASKMSALGTLTGGISHDFNNILQAISTYNQLLMLKKKETDPDWKHLASIDHLTQRAANLIKQLLLFSRRTDSKLEPLDLNEEIRKFYMLLLNTLPKTIEIKMALSDDLHLVSGDASQLSQIIMNISVNAKDAMPTGGLISICTENVIINHPGDCSAVQLQEGEYVRLRISDTGCGMDKETLTHVFEPFFTTKETGKGTGIGLAVVYGILKNHNGHVFCDSEPGRGTTFDFYLPALNVRGFEGTREAVGGAPALSSGGHETILLVDDEPHLLETGRELLTFSGYQVLAATSGEEALSVIREDKKGIALVILDLMMPGMGGLKCLAELLKLVPQMKVIVASGYSANVRTREVMEQGAAAFIKKPYRYEELNKIIRKVLEG
ncbi:MAG: PAS domain S-box protein [Syntrophales bacterium]